MLSDAKAAEQTCRNAEPGWMGRALHDLCQPLTALELRLSLAVTPDAGGMVPTQVELQKAIEDSLVECARLIDQVRSMQERLLA